MLFNECCLKTMAKYQDSFDLVVTSPPYDSMRNYDWDPSIIPQVFDGLFKSIKKGGVLVWIVGDATIKGSESCSSFKQALLAKETGFRLHDTMIWNKGSFAFPSNYRYHQVFEYMFVFSKGAPSTFNPIKDRKNKTKKSGGVSGRNKDGTRRDKGNYSLVHSEYGQRFNIWNYPIGGNQCTKDKIAYEHPAIFPENLAIDHIISWSNEGDLVYDPFTGSGTVWKACLMTNRLFVGSEISKEYCDIAEKRLECLKQ